MRSIAFLLLAALGVLALSGCSEPEPRYHAELLAYEPGLIGTWRYESQKKTDQDGKPVRESVELALEPRRLNIQNGRVEPEALDESKRPKSGPFNAYTGTITAPVSDKESAIIECKGFVIQVEGAKYLAFQPSTRQMGIGHLGGLVLPIHQVVKVERSGDRLTMWGSHARIAWLPDVEWLDAPPGPPAGEPELRGKDGSLCVTGDIDRFVAVLRKYGPRQDFWEEPIVMERVK